MKNPPKFLICYNEAAASGKTYIVHTQKPTFLAVIHKFSNEEEIEEFKKNVGHTNFYYIQSFQLGIEVVMFFAEFFELPKKFNITLKKALNWYIHAQGGKSA